jgi:Ferredoxin-like domain in Api92-like protein
MPNWVYNGLTIEGNPEEINKLVAQMNKPYTQVHDNWNMQTQQMEKKLFTYPNPIFAFHNIYNHTQDGVSDEEYISQPQHKSGESFDEMFKGNDWYSWNVRNWGTKWDVAVHSDKEYSDTNVEGPVPNGENAVVHYNFNTAWSPPFPVIAKLSAQYPSLLFTHSYEEETGWGGECEFLRGEQLDGSEYGWKCRECDNEEEDTPYCEECDFDTCPSCGYNEADEPCNEHREANK